MRVEDLDLAFEAACEAGWRPEDEETDEELCAREAWMEAHDPQPELPLAMEEKEP